MFTVRSDVTAGTSGIHFHLLPSSAKSVKPSVLPVRAIAANEPTPSLGEKQAPA